MRTTPRSEGAPGVIADLARFDKLRVLGVDEHA